MIKIKIIIVLLILSAINIYPEENFNLTVDNALDLALMNNLNIKIEKSNYDEKLISLISNFNNFIPSTSFSGGLSDSQVLPNTDNKYTNSLSLNFDLSLTLNAGIIFNIYQTVLDYNEGKITLESAKLNLIKETKKAYFNLKLNDEKIKLQEIELINAKEKYNIALKNYNQGETSEIDKLNAELYYKKIIPALLKMKNEYKNQFQNFKILLGIKKDKNIILVDDLPDYTNVQIEKIKSLDLNNDLKIKLLYAELNTNHNALNKSISSMTPSFKFGYSIGSSFLKDPFADAWFNNKDDWQNTQNFKLFVSIPIDPIFPFSSYQVDIEKKSFQIYRTKLKIENNIELRKLELESKINTMQEIIQSLDMLNFNITIAERAYKLTERGYYDSQKTYLELKDAEKNYMEAKISYLNSKFELYSIITDVENITNKKISDLF